jgi:hypothetical protein
VTLLIAAIAALWVLGAIAIFMLLSFGAMDDDTVGRVMIAAFWPLAMLFLASLCLVEAIRSRNA